MQLPPDVFEEASLYLRIVGSGIMIQGLYFSLVACFRGHSWTKTTMCVSLGMNVFHIGSNALLIFGCGVVPALGVLGVGISTNCSKLLGLITLAYIFKRYLKVEISWKYLHPFPWDSLRQILRISIPSGGETLSYQLSQTVIMKIVNIFGLTVITTKVYVAIIATFCYMYALALSSALQIIVGYFIGAGREDLISHKVWRTVLASVTICSGLTTVFILAAITCCASLRMIQRCWRWGKRSCSLRFFLKLAGVSISSWSALYRPLEISRPR